MTNKLWVIFMMWFLITTAFCSLTNAGMTRGTDWVSSGQPADPSMNFQINTSMQQFINTSLNYNLPSQNRQTESGKSFSSNGIADGQFLNPGTSGISISSSSQQKSTDFPQISGATLGDADSGEQPSAVPLPGAVWLLGSGLVSLIYLRRKTPGIE